MSDLADLGPSDFEACVGDEVGVLGPDGLRVMLTVRSVDARGPGWDRSEAFSVLLVGPRDPSLGQGVFGIEHPRLPAVELLIVPVGRDREDGLLYEAIFN